jgi:putative MATE family efflux protein
MNNSLQISYRTLLKVAIPMSLGAFIQFFVVFTDNYFSAQINGTAMSAVSYIGLVYITLVMITSGIASAVQIIVARRTGENQTEGLPFLMRNALQLGLLIAAIQFFTLYLITPYFLPKLIQDEQTRNFMVDFLRIRSWGFWVYTPTLLLQSYWSGKARTRVIMYTMLITSLSNVFLAWAWVQGNAGFPAWGIQGVAYATLTAESLACLFLIIFSLQSTDLRHAMRQVLVPHFKASREILTLGLPIVFQMLIALGVWLAFYTMIESMGQASLQSAFVVRQMYSLAWVSVMGFSATTRTYVSGLIAEKRSADLSTVIRRLMFMNVTGIVLLTHGLLLYPEWLAHHFTQDALTLQLATDSMRLVFPAMLIFSLTSILLAVVEGSGNTLAGFWIEVITSFAYLFSAYAMIHWLHWNVVWAWSADYIYFIVIGLCSYYFLRTRPWKTHAV